VGSAAELAAALGNLPASGDILLTGTITLITAESNFNISQDVKITGGTISLGGFSAFEVSTGGTLTLNGVGFEGGAAATSPPITVTAGKADLTSCTFNNNTASGAVSVAGGEAIFTTCTFTGNSAAGNGGAVNVTGGTVTFNGNTFTGNSTTGTGDGGAVNIAGGTVTFTGGTFTGNSATGNGGAINVATGGTVAFTGGALTFTNKEAANGGAIYSMPIAIDSKFTFTGNAATAGGGAVYFTGNATIAGGTFNTNKTTGTGGNGGAVYVNGALALSGGGFSSNIAAENGGAAYGSGTVDVSGGTFTGNEAASNGGAVWAGGASTISGGTFTNSKANGSGGAFYGAGAVRVTAGSFVNNESAGSASSNGGGAIFAVGNIDVTPSGDSMAFDGQTARNHGGALFSSGDITLTNVVFRDNKTVAGTGGATYSGGTSTFTNCVFGEAARGNLAGNSGGGVYAGAVKASKTTFRANNAAGGYGGAVYLAPGTGTSEFNDCLFESNQAKVDGGAVYVTGDQHVTIFRTSVFDKNYSAGARGGAASLRGSSALFSRCTFTGNYVESSADAEGGAVFTDAATFKFGNCTFVGNEAGSGKGGALSFGGGTTQDSVVFYCTFTENLAGGGQGGAVYTSAATVNFVGSAFVGNTATYGYDVFRGGGAIISRGYNILGNYGATGASGPAGNVDWSADPNVTGQNGRNGSDKCDSQYTRALLFGSNQPADNVPSGGSSVVTGSSLSATQTLNTLETAQTTLEATNPALDYIPGQTALNLFNSYFAGIAHTDARGAQRPIPSGGNSDVGAFERGDGIIPSPPTGNVISYVRMSSIPNTMVKVGQTCSLTALVYFQNGSSSSAEAVVWNSSNPNVAAIDQYGNLVSLMQGKTTISVTTDRLDANNQHAADSADLTVSEEWSYTNVHPDVWRKLGAFNDGIREYTEQLYLVDADPEGVKKASFADAFKKLYGVSASQVSEFSNANAIAFNSKSSYTASNWASVKPSISVSLSSLPAGSLLPLKFSYGLTWDELSEILGREVTKVDNVTDLFGRLKLIFENANGIMSPVVDGDGEFGIAASQALSSGVLTISNGNNGLALTLEILLADTKTVADGKPQAIDKRLVVADAVADGTAVGSMWLLKRTGNGGGGGSTGEGGGGGCNAGFGFLPFLLFAMLGIRNCRK
jgi:predicted outer membrane repeat protein